MLIQRFKPWYKQRYKSLTCTHQTIIHLTWELKGSSPHPTNSYIKCNETCGNCGITTIKHLDVSSDLGIYYSRPKHEYINLIIKRLREFYTEYHPGQCIVKSYTTNLK